MRRRFSATVKLALFASFTLIMIAPQAEAGPPQKVVTVEGITEYRLDNGLRVLLFPDKSRPTVTVNLTVFVGSRHEGYGETGMAHLLEHMVFKGTPTHPQIPKVLTERGARFNGTTSYDRTNYFETLPASDSNLEFAIRLEADRLVNSYIKREDLISEMTVVRNEFERGENVPENILSQRMMAVAYEWHNYGKTTIGNRSDIERVPIENLQAFYRRFYQPDNAMLVVAGQFDESKALAFIEKYFGAIPKPQRKLDTTYTEEPAQDGERVVVLRRVGDVGVVGVLYHIPAGPHPDIAAIQVLEQLMTSTPSGRLYKALVESKKASSVSGSALPLHDPGVVEFMAEVDKGNSLEEVRDILIAKIEEVVKNGVTTAEVDRARGQLLKQRELAAQDTSTLAVGLSNWAAQGDWRLYFLHRDRLEKVTPADVQAAAARYLHATNRTVGMFIPTEKPDRIAIPATPNVKTLVADYKGKQTVAEGESFDPSPANVESRTRRINLPEGIKATLLPKKTRNEAVNLQLTLRYGNEENLKNLATAAGFLDDLMLKGTKKYTRQQLQDELDRLKATMTAGAGGFRRASSQTGAISFTIQAKRDTLPATLELLRQVLREPTLPASEFEILKRTRLTRLEAQRSDPQALAVRHVQRQLAPYPKDDVRYLPTIEEEIARIQAVTLDQVKQLYSDFLGSQHGELAIVGDFDPDASLPILTEAFKGWKARQPYARIERPAKLDVAGERHAINTPDKANATYFAGILLPVSDGDPDYPALLMGDFILGGGSLSSRLGDRVRQKDGLSYGVGSMFGADSHDKRATLGLFAICNPENMPKVEKAIREEIDRLLKDGVTADELERAKQGYLQQQKVSRTSDNGLAGLLSGTSYRGRSMSYYTDLEKKIESLTPAEVNDAMRRYFNPEKLIIAVGGDFGKKPADGGK